MIWGGNSPGMGTLTAVTTAYQKKFPSGIKYADVEVNFKNFQIMVFPNIVFAFLLSAFLGINFRVFPEDPWPLEQNMEFYFRGFPGYSGQQGSGLQLLARRWLM